MGQLVLDGRKQALGPSRSLSREDDFDKSARLILKNPLHVRNPKVAHSVRYGWEAVRWRSERKERSPQDNP
jgi:hypothetical protein